MLRKGSAKSSCTRSRTNSKLPSQEVPHAGSEEPEHPMLRKGVDSPGFARSSVNGEDPNLDMLRNGKGRPNRTKSRADRNVPDQQTPKGKNALPGRAWLCSGGAEPECRKSEANSAKPV